MSDTEQIDWKEFFSIEIPSVFLDKIKFVFKNDDDTDWSYSNVAYVFKDGPIECPFYPGYYYIPGFSRYVINKFGEVLTVKTRHLHKWSLVKPSKNTIRGGYVVMSLISDYGKRTRNITRHRALGITFLKPIEENPYKYVINHKNGIGGDDVLDNLEWCTHGENVQHAYDNGLYNNKLAPIDVLNYKTGFIGHFSSIKDFCSFSGLSHNLVSSRLIYGNNKRYEDGWRIKRTTEQWLDLNDRVGQLSTERQVIGRRIDDNHQFIFHSIAQAQEFTGFNYGTIQTHCDVRARTPFKGWNFRYFEDFVFWPEYTEQQLQIFKDHPVKPSDGIEIYDIDTNTLSLYTSPEKAAEIFGISKITVSKFARYNKTWKNRYKFNLVRIRQDF